MYDTITIAPVHTGWWYLLLLVIPAVIIFCILLVKADNNGKIDSDLCTILMAISILIAAFVTAMVFVLTPAHTERFATDRQHAAMIDQLHYKHVFIDEEDRFTASTADGMYVSGMLVDDGDNVYTIKYTVAP